MSLLRTDGQMRSLLLWRQLWPEPADVWPPRQKLACLNEKRRQQRWTSTNVCWSTVRADVDVEGRTSDAPG